MHDKAIVINTSPLLALIAAWGDLERLRHMYRQVLVPREVCDEICQGGPDCFGIAEFESANFLGKQEDPLTIAPLLRNSLDKGEASVIQLALNQGIDTVCIDEIAGRRVARLNELRLTGSTGILIRAWREKPDFSVPTAIERMQARGIYLSDTVVKFALRHGTTSP
jgi:predicted nucleic acid-binding protein